MPELMQVIQALPYRYAIRQLRCGIVLIKPFITPSLHFSIQRIDKRQNDVGLMLQNIMMKRIKLGVNLLKKQHQPGNKAVIIAVLVAAAQILKGLHIQDETVKTFRCFLPAGRIIHNGCGSGVIIYLIPAPVVVKPLHGTQRKHTGCVPELCSCCVGIGWG